MLCPSVRAAKPELPLLPLLVRGVNHSCEVAHEIAGLTPKQLMRHRKQ